VGFEECAGGGGTYRWECGGEVEAIVLIEWCLISCECVGADVRWGRVETREVPVFCSATLR